MNILYKDIVIVGGGPAGLAAAVAAFDAGNKSVVIIERDAELGGILQQCIHNGFGLTRFKQNLTGPEYAARFIAEVERRDIEVLKNTTVLDVSADKIVTVTNRNNGIFSIHAKAVVLAMGCRERSKGALNIAGFRPAGLFSAGTAQKYINIKGLGVGKNVVVLGSGDIGLIMARRLSLEGAKVHAVCEIMPYSSGLRRNIVQCLDDFNIPLLLSHTIVFVHGRQRVEGVTIAKVNDNKVPIAGSERFIPCDTVLFSVGLIPENELTAKIGASINSKTRGCVVDEQRQTSVQGVFSCGNVLHVHDLVDFVSEEAEIAGKGAALFVQGGQENAEYLPVSGGKGVFYVVPQRINRCAEQNVKLFFRVDNVYRNATVLVRDGDRVLRSKKLLAAAPSEMETLVLKKDEIANVTELMVEVVCS